MIALRRLWSHTDPSPGIYTGVGEEAYHSHPSVSKSTLKYLDPYLGHVPLDALDYMHHGLEETDAIRNGRAMELALLDPEGFEDRAVAKRTFTGDGAHAARDAWIEEQHLEGRIVVDRKFYDRALRTRELVESRPALRDAIAARQQQLSLLWQDEATGEWVRTRPDLASLTERPHFCWDVKHLSKGLGRKSVEEHLRTYGAALQAATFREGFRAITGQDAPACYLLAISGKGPIDVRVIRIDQDWLDYGHVTYRETLDRYAKCKRENHWPGHIDAGVTTHPMAEWLRTQTDQRLMKLQTAPNR